MRSQPSILLELSPPSGQRALEPTVRTCPRRSECPQTGHVGEIAASRMAIDFRGEESVSVSMARRKRAIDQKLGRAGLAMLSVAIGELMEAEHETSVAVLPASHAARLRHVMNLKQIGSDIEILASAAEVLVRRGG